MPFRRYFSTNKSNGNDDDETLNCNSYHLLQRIKTSKPISKFEYLPNELILTIFEYLYCHDLLYAFNQLNHRFQLLLHSNEYYHLNFSNITMKSKFNLIQHLPINIQHVKSLTLSNKNDSSCTNIEQCLLIYPFELFYTRLQSLSLVENDDNRLVSHILLLPNFEQLKYLLISKRNISFHNIDIIKQIRNIILFEIKRLKYFTWDSLGMFFERIDRTFPIKKSNIEHYKFSLMDIPDLEWLNAHTIDMKSINVDYFNISSNSLQSQQQTLISIKIDHVKLENIQTLFACLSFSTRLKQLELSGSISHTGGYIDGYELEYLIRRYTPELKMFKFLFTFSLVFTSITINELIESFMTQFWLIEKKWFITYDHHAQNERINIYTVPYMNSKLEYSILCQRRSTARINHISNVRQLILHSIETKNLFNDRFTNVQSLTLCEIPDDVTYDQLNTFLNISSINHIRFGSQMNPKLFLAILKYNTTQMSLEINNHHLKEMLRTATYSYRHQIILQLKKIKKLTLYHKDFRIPGIYIISKEKQIRKLCYLFSNIEELTIEGALESIELIPLLLYKFEHISFLSVFCRQSEEIGNENIRQWLINRSRKKLNEHNFICKWIENNFYIWID